MEKKNKPIIAISGVGGAGKNAILEVFEKYPEKFGIFVSYTERPQRAEETDGMPYHFISREEFTRALENDEFLEWEQVRGDYRYGKKKADLEKIWNAGKIPVMQIDVLGLQKFNKKDYNIISFFIIPPSREEAERRMRSRGTDTEEGLKHRIERYDLEMSYKDKYDYVIVNDDLEKAQEEVLRIVDKIV